MNLRDIKSSMLYQACEYEYEAVSMVPMHDINQGAQVYPEADAARFYLGAHILGEVESTFGVDADLPPAVEDLVVQWQANMEEVFFRIFSYLVLICVGESRHRSPELAHQEYVSEKFGESTYEFACVIHGGQRSGARHQFLQDDRNIVAYMQYFDWAFVNMFSGGGYGGPAWKEISHKVTQVLSGEISPFTMTDVAWAMVHNNGSIFNKHTIYKDPYNSTGLTQLLDMQRGGAIPAMIKNYSEYQSNMPYFKIWGGLTNMFEMDVDHASLVLGKHIGEYIEPSVIKNAGAIDEFVSLEEPEEGPVDFVTADGVFNIGPQEYQLLERAGT